MQMQYLSLSIDEGPSAAILWCKKWNGGYMQREEEKASITGSRNRVNMSQAIARG